MKRYKDYIPYLLTFVFATLLFELRMGLEVIDPLNLYWLMNNSEDWMVHFMGWHYFRDIAWDFPLGKLTDYFYPSRSSIGYTDSIPLVAILLKPFSKWLPEDFQYLGVWLYSCYILQGFFGVKWLKSRGLNAPLALILGAFFLVAVPVLSYRLMHPALSTHWLLIASFYNYERKSNFKSILKFQAILLLLSAFIHPYMTTMILGLSLAVFARAILVDRLAAWWVFLLTLLGSLMLVFLSWWLIGYFSFELEETATESFGYFAANVNGFFNPLPSGEIPTSYFLSPLASLHQGEYEGYAYLGLGMIILLGIRVAIWAGNPNLGSWKKYLPLLLVVLGLTAVAYSNVWRWGDFIIMKNTVGGFWEKLFGTFQSSGRFIWAFYYLIVAWVLLGFFQYKKIKSTSKYALAGALLLVQLIDVSPLVLSSPWLYDSSKTRYESPLDLERLDVFCEASDKIIIYPLYAKQITYFMDYKHWLYLGNRHKIPVTAGYFARNDYERTEAYRRQIWEKLHYAYLNEEKEALFVVKKGYLNDFIPLIKKGLLHGTSVGDYDILWGAHRVDLAEYNRLSLVALDSFFNQYKNNTILLSVKDDATTAECKEAFALYREWGGRLDSLGFRESYLGVVHQGKVAFDTLGNEKIQLEWQVGDKLGNYTLKNAIAMTSAGETLGNETSIMLDGREAAYQTRGINMVVLDEQGKVMTSIVFDTFSACEGVTLR